MIEKIEIENRDDEQRDRDLNNIKGKKKIRELLISLLEKQEFDRAIELWVEILQDEKKVELNNFFKQQFRPYKRNIGYSIYSFYEKFGIEKITPLLENNNLDHILGYLEAVASIIKRSKFLSIVIELYDLGFRSERLIGLYVHAKCRKGNFVKCLKVLNKELGEAEKKIINLKNLFPTCQALLIQGKPEKAIRLIDNFLDYQQKDVERKIFFKHLIYSFSSRAKVKIRGKFLEDLELLFNTDIEHFNSLMLRCATTEYHSDNIRLLEVIKNLEDKLKSRGKLETENLQESTSSLKELAVEFQGYLDRAIRSDDRKPPRKKLEDLQVALCISGQLRGYEKAFQSWDEHILKPLKPDIFIHTWSNTGFKEPAIAYAFRVIEGNFLPIYKKSILNNYSSLSEKEAYTQFKQDYPAFARLLDSKSQECNFQQLSKFYNTRDIVIDNEEDDAFKDKINQMKMLYKIEACNNLRKNSGKQYDLVIRIRPDIELINFNIDWQEVYDRCYDQNKIFIDNLKGAYVLGAGDVFAVGSEAAIDWYCALHRLVDFYANHNLINAKDYAVHKTLFWHLWYGGFNISSFDLGFDLLTPKLSAEELYTAFSQDINLSSAKDFELEMLQVLKEDLEIETK